MSHITQEQAMSIADASGVLGCKFSEFEQKMCDFANAAIQHYIDSAALAQPEPVSPLEKRNLEGLGMSSTYFRGLGWNEAIDALAAAKGGAL